MCFSYGSQKKTSLQPHCSFSITLAKSYFGEELHAYTHRQQLQALQLHQKASIKLTPESSLGVTFQQDASVPVLLMILRC